MTLISNPKVYDLAKWTAAVFLPALNLFWLAVAPVWGFAHVQEVSVTIAGVNAFLGALVGVSNAQYYKAESK